MGAKTQNLLQNSWVRILIAAICITAISLFIISFRNNPITAEEVVEKKINALRLQDFSRAYFEYMSGSFRNEKSLEEFRNTIKKNKILSENNSIFISDKSNKNKEVILTITLKNVAGDKLPAVYHLIKEKNNWKISSFELLDYGTFVSKEHKKNIAIAEIIKKQLVDSQNSESENKPQEDESSQEATTQTDPLGMPKENAELKEIASSFLNLLGEEKITPAYEDFTAAEFKEITTGEEFRKFTENYPELTNFESYLLEESQADNDLHSLNITLKNATGDSELQIWLKKEMGLWKIYGINILESSTYPPLDFNEKSQVVQVIEDQLSAIRNRDISKAYYAFASEEFEKLTSIEDFKNYINENPLLTRHTKVQAGEGIKEGKLRLVRMTLVNSEDEAEVDFRLVRENGIWKVWGIEVITDPEDSIKSKNSSEIASTIHNQLTAIQNQDHSKAYYAYGSKEFQDKTAASKFNDFLEAHPIFENSQSFKIEDLVVNDNSANVLIKIFNKANESEVVEYQFVKEGNKWKIQSIEALSTQKDVQGNTHIEKVLIGTQTNKEGIVINPTTIFPSRDSDIKINFFIENGKKDETLTVKLEHIESGLFLPPLSSTIVEDGYTIISLELPPPGAGWPIGSYEIGTKTPSGSVQKFHFTVTGTAR